MGISWYDELLGYDWVRYAKTTSRACCLTSLGIGALSFVLSFTYAYAFAAVLMGAILAIWEFPFVYRCIPQFEEFQTFVLQSLYMEREEGKAVLYLFFGILCFLHASMNMILGLMFLTTAVIMGLAVLNKRTDSFDSRYNHQPIETEDTDSLIAQYGFKVSSGSGRTPSSTAGVGAAAAAAAPATGSLSSFVSSITNPAAAATAAANESSAGSAKKQFGTFSAKQMMAEV